MTDKVFFTLKKPWTDKANGIMFTTEDVYQGVRIKQGIVVTGASSFTHTIPYDIINEEHLNPEFGKKK